MNDHDLEMLQSEVKGFNDDLEEIWLGHQRLLIEANIKEKVMSFKDYTEIFYIRRSANNQNLGGTE